MVTAFEAACGAGENDFGHWWSLANQPTLCRLVWLASKGRFGVVGPCANGAW
jgi:hypothetical protein